MTGRQLSADVLVVGGGLAGCATAYFLARDGVDVLLIEQQDLNMLASGANAGGIHGQIPHEMFREEGEAWTRFFAPTLPLMLASADLWAGFEAELEADIEFSRCGGLLVAETEAQMQEIARKSAIDLEFGVTVELLGREELRSFAPYLADYLVGGAYCPNEAKANPLLATPALANAAHSHGARIMRQTRLEALEQNQSGFLATTTAGDIHAGKVVNCAGAMAGRIAAMVGFDLPIQGYPIQVNVTEPAAPLVPLLLYSGGERLTLKQTPRGAFLIGGGWAGRIDPTSGLPVVDHHSVVENLRYAIAAVPQLEHVQLVRTWAAMVNGTRDWRPILGTTDQAKDFYMCMFPWMGFTGGPIAARIVADMVLGREPQFDLSPFALTA